MNTLLRLIEKQNIAALLLIVITVLVFPNHNVSAQTTEPNLVFDVSEEKLAESMLSFDELKQQDYLVQSLRKYLEEKQSPLAPDADKIVQLQDWQHAMGIVFVESNFCRFARNYNCGSLGVKPGHNAWRQYKTAYEGFADLTELLQKPLYKDRLNTCAKKKGVYVVPGSTKWVRGCEKVQKEMEQLVAEADAVRQELASQQLAASKNTKELALAF